MKSGALWRVSVTTAWPAEEAVAELLESIVGQPAGSYSCADTGKTTVSAYLKTKAQWTSASRKKVTQGLQRLARAGLDVGPGKTSLTRIPREDWAESWKRHFRPFLIGSMLLIKPSWSRRVPQRGQAVVVLDPGLSFGTGHHPTTAYCLHQLVKRRRRGEPQAVLDVGSGSGILAIAAAKLGYGPVDALDCDPEAVRIARHNARANGVSSAIRFRQRDLTQLPCRGERKYAVICANLLANVLIAERGRLQGRLQLGGTLIAAGILRSEFGGVEAAFQKVGLRLMTSRTQNEWRSGAFAWP
jgi:ribosomal protein L11 methyltransferase